VLRKISELTETMYEEVGENRKIKSCMIYTLTKHYNGKQMEKDERGGTNSTYGGDEKCKQGSGGET